MRTSDTGPYPPSATPWLLLAVCCLSGPGMIRAQVPGVAFTDTVRVSVEGSIRVRPFLVDGSVRVFLPGSDTTLVSRIEAARGVIWLAGRGVRPGATVVASYRALDLGLRAEYRLDRQPYPDVGNPAQAGRPRAPVASGAGGTSLRSSGSVSRGVIAGSGRDVALESGLRLELEGELAPGVSILASLTDADSPIRPDGSTQRLSEFDRVFIRLGAAPGHVILGDFDARLMGGRFGGLARKLQGAWMETSTGGRVRVQAAGATSRGQFRSQEVLPVDGVQGPYRLEGARGEQFIVILPGTERVYLDGRPLRRGAPGGYTIDYTTGEVRFGPGNVISSDRRILIEFEYSTNQFTRTLVASSFDVGIGRPEADGSFRFSAGGTVIREADSGEFLSEFGLTAADSVLLAAAGDAPAFRSGAEVVAFDPEARYTQYVVEYAGSDSMFVAVSSRPEAERRVYRVQFSRVGRGLGSYVREAHSLNGILYVWRGPGLGDYEPLRQLPSPASRTLVDMRGRAEPVPGLVLSGEWATSWSDLNRLSPLDSGDDGGSAMSLSAQSPEILLGAVGKVQATGSFRQTSASFSAFERFRPVEFAREWNVTSIIVDPLRTVAGADHEREAEGSLRWSRGDSTSATFRTAMLDLPGVFEASRWGGEASMRSPRFPDVSAAFSQVSSTDFVRGLDGSWSSLRTRVERPSGSIGWFLEVEHEDRQEGGDSLHATALRFLEVRPGVLIPGSSGRLSLQLERRNESWPVGGVLVHAADSWTVSAAGDLDRGAGFRHEVEVAWRVRDVTEQAERASLGTDTRALLLAMNGAASRGSLTASWLYDARTERTPVLQEIYLRAGAELGAYVWEDANGDDVVQLDELLPETTPNEGEWVRTFLPSDSLASVNTVRVRATARYQPPAGSGAFASRLEAQSLVEIEEHSRNPNRSDVYLLRLGRFREPGVTTNGRFRFRQDLSLRPSGRRVGGNLVFQETRSLTELASGVEERSGRLGEALLRVRLSTMAEFAIRVSASRDATDSDRFASRRFDIRARRLAPALTIRGGGNLTLSASTELALKSEERAQLDVRMIRVPLSLRIARPGRADILLRAELADISVSGTGAAPSGLAAFELTDGRGPGRSGLWGVTAQWSLNANLRASVGYDGRAPAAGRVIHTGRMQLSAVF